MLPVVALVGRPNVGKSTLFNALTGTRDALVADEPGLTRDRQYGYGQYGETRFIVIDTGGLVESPRGVEEPMARQTLRAIEEADQVVLIVDGQEGLANRDRFVGELLRRSGRPVTIAVNKCEGREAALAVAEIHALGLGEPRAQSAVHRQASMFCWIGCWPAGRPRNRRSRTMQRRRSASAWSAGPMSASRR